MSTRRTFLSAIAGLAACGVLAPAGAQALGKPFVVYDDELKNGWQSWSWAKVTLSVPTSGSKPMKVEGDAWSALALHHDAFSTEGYSKLVFYINGGPEGGQSLMVKASADGKQIASDYVIKPKAKTWTVVEIALSELGAQGKSIDGIVLQAQGEAYRHYYITRIQFE